MRFARGALAAALLLAAERAAPSASSGRRAMVVVAAAFAFAAPRTPGGRHRVSSWPVCRLRAGSAGLFGGLDGGSGGGGSGSGAQPYGTTALGAAAAPEATAAAEAPTNTAPPAPPTEVFRRDYRPPPYTVTTVELDLDISSGKTVVKSRLHMARNPRAIAAATGATTPPLLELDGDETCLTLREVSLNGRKLTEGTDYAIRPGKLVLLAPPPVPLDGDDGSSFTLDMVADTVPEDNTRLSGIYYSDPMYCTQCEAEGFRRITYYPDRPDVMATFARVRLEADAAQCPVLLSNGNLLEQGAVADKPGRHYAVWSDPFPKPRCVVG